MRDGASGTSLSSAFYLAPCRAFDSATCSEDKRVNTQEEVRTVEVRILARLWEEDGVWNVSSFDLPVVAFGKTMTEAQRSFEDAMETHFEGLQHINKLQSTIQKLQDLERERDFYESRVTPHVTVQNFMFHPMHSFGMMCLSGG